jgi:tetratricopeptide (TPR) repeat protein
MQSRPALAAVVVLAGAALGGCSGHSAEWAKCMSPAGADDELQPRLAACSVAIGQGLSGDSLEQALAQRGETYRQLSDEAHARQDLDRALQLKPDDPKALTSRGLIYLDDGKSDLALADFSAAIRADPTDGLAYNYRGYLERSKGEADAAIADESHAIELDPDLAVRWANRGYAYLDKHQWDTALADFGDALKRAPKYEFALQGRAEAERGKGDAKDAASDFDAVLSNDPHGANALADAQAMVELSPPGDPGALNARCWVRGVLDVELEAALADCQQSLATRPYNAETLDSQALIYFRLGRFGDAIGGYTAALTADPKQVESRFMLGVAELRAGNVVAGQADISAAEASESKVAERFASYGIAP